MGGTLDVVVAELPPGETDAAAALLARGMQDNPINVAVFGDDAARRLRMNRRMFQALFRVMTAQAPLAAHAGGRLVGVTGVAPPGTCQPTPGQGLRLLPSVISGGPLTAVRAVRWTSTWAGRDPREPHAHLGPLAVEPELRGRGIGSRIMVEHCRRLEAAGLAGYLETDKPENVRLYRRFGFEVVGEAPVLDVSCWFMLRTARR